MTAGAAAINSPNPLLQEQFVACGFPVSSSEYLKQNLTGWLPSYIKRGVCWPGDTDKNCDFLPQVGTAKHPLNNELPV